MTEVPAPFCAPPLRVRILAAYWQAFRRDRGTRSLNRFFRELERDVEQTAFSGRNIEQAQFRKLLAK